eukprot:11517394-Alexandrium_andersonii.AAC.1
MKLLEPQTAKFKPLALKFRTATYLGPAREGPRFPGTGADWKGGRQGNRPGNHTTLKSELPGRCLRPGPRGSSK